MNHGFELGRVSLAITAPRIAPQLNSETGVLQENGDSTRDLNVEPAWVQGVTGCNVIVGVVDDGECILIHTIFILAWIF